jgi:ABC-type dipeptide/oligopeptide/nickel transport system permease subunit
MILFEATLGFLGLAEPDIPILGNVINDGRTQIFNYSYQLLIPVSFLVVTTVVMQLVSSAIQDAFKMGVSE